MSMSWSWGNHSSTPKYVLSASVVTDPLPECPDECLIKLYGFYYWDGKDLLTIVIASDSERTLYEGKGYTDMGYIMLYCVANEYDCGATIPLYQYYSSDLQDYYVNVNSDRGSDEDGYTYTMQTTPTMPLCYVWSPVNEVSQINTRKKRRFFIHYNNYNDFHKHINIYNYSTYYYRDTNDTASYCGDGKHHYSIDNYSNYYYRDYRSSLKEEKEIVFKGIPPEEQEKIIEDVTYDPTLTRDYIPFLIGGYPDEIRKDLSYTKEETFYGASYEDKGLDISRDFTEIYDKSLGTCYTFNHENGSMHYKLRKPGLQEGLAVLLRVYPHEYLSWTVLSGFMIFVHDNSEAIVSDSPRINTRSGSHTNLLIDMAKYVRLGGRYGKCANSINEVKNFYYLGSYTTDGCLRSCYQDAVYEECGCMDPRYPSDSAKSMCTLAMRQCLNDMLATRGDPSEWTDCECPVPCTNTDFRITWSETIMNKIPVECSNPNKASAPTTTSPPSGRKKRAIIGIKLGTSKHPHYTSHPTYPSYPTTTTTDEPTTSSENEEEDDDDDFSVPPAANASSCTHKEVFMYNPVGILMQLFNLIKGHSKSVDYMLLIIDTI
ncbi:hypothetical protein WR25_13570 [Diploscapter pachys]|uniref:Uncharacterized protein n=1 Tax=Diploscapter pachys TaxID=2018661 RepID=A0A2A2JCU6_9BILA|nr:hypothetical protein WR25_13570 [Diploscapter pachys]